MLATTQFRALITDIVVARGLPGWGSFTAAEWVEGQVLAESAGRHDLKATRYEPHLDRVADGDRPGVDDGTREDDKSYGLMQILGVTAKDLLGIPLNTGMDYSWLMDPVTNLSLGTLYLKRLIIAVPNQRVDIALARYNGGGRDNPDAVGKLRNQSYVNRIHEHTKIVLRSKA